MNSRGNEYIDHQIDENYIDTGEHCSDKTCNGILIMSYNANGPDDYARTWECNKCGLTESE